MKKGSSLKRFAAFVLFCTFSWFAPSTSRAAGTVTVADEANLRAALAGGGAVTFACDGVFVLSSTLIITNDTTLDASGRSVTLSGSDAVRVLQVNPGVHFTLNNLTVANGRTNRGAGILNDGTTTVINCMLTNNNAIEPASAAAVGGGIYNRGTLTLLSSTFSLNRAIGTNSTFGFGGAILNDGLLTATNCTFHSNSVAGSVMSGVGGAINSEGSASVVNCTLYGNRAATGGAIAAQNGHLFLLNTILANSYEGSSLSGDPDYSVTDGGYNLTSDDSSYALTNVTTRGNTNPKLGPLATNGGPTWTMALLPDSPAIDMATSAGAPTVDQRGVPRSFGAAPDIGAFEVNTASAGSLQFASLTYSVSENGTNVIITVSRESGSAGTVTVDFATTNGTALAGSDYASTNGTLVFPEGETTRSFLVRVLDDSEVEGDETVHLALANPTGGAALGLATAVLTITDNDSQFAFSRPDYSVVEQEGGAAISVTRSGILAATASVVFATSNGTALAGSDYVGTNGTLVFAEGEATQSFVVPILDDFLSEDDETVHLTLSNPTGGATLGLANAVLTILNDESQFAFSSASYAVGENGGSATITVLRSGYLGGPASVGYNAGDGTATGGFDYWPTNGTLAFAPGQESQTLSVSIINDVEVEPTETVLLALTGPTGGTTLGTPANAVLSILDDDTAGVKVVGCDEASLRAGLAGGGTVRFSCDGLIVLTSPLVIANDTVLEAAGHSITLSGNDAVRVLEIRPGVIFSMTGLTVANGRTNSGAGLFNDGGNVTLLDCVFAFNQALGTNGVVLEEPYWHPTDGEPAFGGAVWSSGTLTAVNTAFRTNIAKGGNGYTEPGGVGFFMPVGGASSGGAIQSIGNLSLTNCSFDFNTTAGGKGGDSYYGGPGGDASGGAIYHVGAMLAMSSCFFHSNSASAGFYGYYGRFGFRGIGQGGAICSLGQLQIEETTFASNSVAGTHGRGGGIFHTNGAMTVLLSSFVGNCAFGDKTTGYYRAAGGVAEGGAICNQDSGLVTDSLFVGNTVTGGQGRVYDVTLDGTGVNGGPGEAGAVFNSGALELVRCALAGNRASGGKGSDSHASSDQPGPGGAGLGGAVHNTNGQLRIVNSTIRANSAVGGAGGDRVGSTAPFGGMGGTAWAGALWTTNGSVFITNCTIVQNLALSGIGGTAQGTNPGPEGAGFFGGIVSTGTGTLNLQNSILAQNGNGDLSGGFQGDHNLIGGDPRVSPIRDNGGPTPTLALLPDSPALDAATSVPGLATDQRGVERPFGPAPDIGAYEWNGTNFYTFFELTSVGPTDGQWRLRGVGPTNQSFRVLSSTNLVEWSESSPQMTGPYGLFEWLDPSTAFGPARFYQTVSP